MNSNKSLDIIGLNAPEAYTEIILSMEEIDSFCLLKYSLPPTVENRAELSKTELFFVEKAKVIRKNNRLSYLEILLELCVDSETLPSGIISALNFHQKHSLDRYWIDRNSLKDGKLINLCSNLDINKPLAICSKVKTFDGSVMNIPLLDFHLEKSKKSLELIVEIAKTLLKAPFVVLETNRSYHLVGLILLNDKNALKFLYRSLLYIPIIDHAYVAHQLIEGESTLRISAYNNNDNVPKVILVTY